MTGITADRNFTMKLDQALRAQQAGIIVFFSALNIVLSITAFLGNVLILIALHKVSSIYPPTKLFFKCLAVTDLCVGLVVQPLFATSMMVSITNMDVNVLNFVIGANRVSGFVLCGVSLFTSTAISLDRLLALLLGLRYRHAVTLRRVRVVIFSFWLIITGSTIAINRLWGMDLFMIPICITLSVATSIFCYSRIHLRLRHHQVQLLNNVLQGHPNERSIRPTIARYKKTVATVLWVQLALFACYTPISITTSLDIVGIESHVVTFLTTNSLVYFNSTLNPILYCWKIKEVKKVVKDTLRKLYCL